MAKNIGSETETLSQGGNDEGVARQLQQIIGPEHVLLDEASRQFYSKDLSWLPHEVADVIIQPANLDECNIE